VADGIKDAGGEKGGALLRGLIKKKTFREHQGS
jgi:hypothetical protein